MSLHAGVLGSPISHSLSPVLHAAVYARCGLDWTYDRREVTEDHLSDVLDAALRDSDRVGFSLTMPLKAQLVALAEQRGWSVDSMAQASGVANTWVKTQAGPAIHNTDVAGIVAAVREAELGSLTSAAVVGSGATAVSAVLALAQAGVCEVRLIARNPRTRKDVAALARTQGLAVTQEPLANAVLGAEPLTLSTLPAGGLDGLQLTEAGGRGVLFDVAYASESSKAAQRWRDGGAATISGTRMLVHQAAEQHRLFTAAAGLDAPPVEVIAEIMSNALR